MKIIILDNDNVIEYYYADIYIIEVKVSNTKLIVEWMNDCTNQIVSLSHYLNNFKWYYNSLKYKLRLVKLTDSMYLIGRIHQDEEER